MTGKKWTPAQEVELKTLIEEGANLEEIAVQLKKNAWCHNSEVSAPWIPVAS